MSEDPEAWLGVRNRKKAGWTEHREEGLMVAPGRHQGEVVQDTTGNPGAETSPRSQEKSREGIREEKHCALILKEPWADLLPPCMISFHL